MSQRQHDFNEVNKELRALTSINDVGERFIVNASKCWWAYRIAYEFQISPKEVKTWDADEVMETLAAIGLANRKKPETG